jgi:hypothetical protein
VLDPERLGELSLDPPMNLAVVVVVWVGGDVLVMGRV